MLENPVCPACGYKEPQPPADAAPSNHRSTASLPLGEYLKTGWRLFVNYPAGFVGFFVLYLAIQIGLGVIPYIGGVAGIVVGPPLIMGHFIVSAKLLQRRQPQFSDFFLGFRFFGPLLLTALVGGILTAIGLILLIIPGLYLMVAYIFGSCLVIDRRLDFWAALEKSRLTVNPIWFGVFAFTLLLLLINLAGVVALGVGLLVTVPLSFCTIAAAYADIFGLQSDYSENFPQSLPAEAAPPGE